MIRTDIRATAAVINACSQVHFTAIGYVAGTIRISGTAGYSAFPRGAAWSAIVAATSVAAPAAIAHIRLQIGFAAIGRIFVAVPIPGIAGNLTSTVTANSHAICGRALVSAGSAIVRVGIGGRFAAVRSLAIAIGKTDGTSGVTSVIHATRITVSVGA